jgi:hypothetical protein
MKAYRLYVTDEKQTYAATDGSISLVAYTARQLNLDAEHQYDVKLIETDGISGPDVRTVIMLTADGDTVATLLKAKITKERKSANAEADDAQDDEPAPGNETPAFLPPAAEQEQPAFA